MNRLTLCLTLLAALPAFAQRNTTEITAVAFTPDGKAVVATCADGTLRFLDAAGTEATRVTAHVGGAYGVAVSPDGKRAATAGADQMIRVWDLASRKEVQALKGHTQAAAAVAFSPDGKLLASGGYEGAVRLWDVAKGEEVRKIQATSSRVTAVAFSLDGKLLATAGTRVTPIAGLPLADGDRARLWDLTTGKEAAAIPGQGTNVAMTSDGQVVAVGGYQVEVGGPRQGAGAVINQVAVAPKLRIVVYDRAAEREVLKLDNAGGRWRCRPKGVSWFRGAARRSTSTAWAA
jgi:WD40 repeat protein